MTRMCCYIECAPEICNAPGGCLYSEPDEELEGTGRAPLPAAPAPTTKTVNVRTAWEELAGLSRYEVVLGGQQFIGQGSGQDESLYLASDVHALFEKVIGHGQAPAGVAKDHEVRELVNNLRYIAIKYHDTQQLRSRIQEVVLPFSLPGRDHLYQM